MKKLFLPVVSLKKALRRLNCPAQDWQHLEKKKARFIRGYKRFYNPKKINARSRYEQRRFGPTLAKLYLLVAKGKTKIDYYSSHSLTLIFCKKIRLKFQKFPGDCCFTVHTP